MMLPNCPEMRVFWNDIPETISAIVAIPETVTPEEQTLLSPQFCDDRHCAG
jgi:hypothetical protein